MILRVLFHNIIEGEYIVIDFDLIMLGFGTIVAIIGMIVCIINVTKIANKAKKEYNNKFVLVGIGIFILIYFIISKIKYVLMYN